MVSDTTYEQDSRNSRNSVTAEVSFAFSNYNFTSDAVARESSPVSTPSSFSPLSDGSTCAPCLIP